MFSNAATCQALRTNTVAVPVQLSCSHLAHVDIGAAGVIVLNFTFKWLDIP